MKKACLFGLGLATVLCLIAPANVVADYYDDFSDGDYTGDPNGWDIDNPPWEMLNLVGFTVYRGIVGDQKALRLFADSSIWPYAAYFATVDDGDNDPNTSTTYWDDTTNHYLLVRAYYRGNVYSADANRRIAEVARGA